MPTANRRVARRDRPLWPRPHNGGSSNNTRNAVVQLTTGWPSVLGIPPVLAAGRAKVYRALLVSSLPDQSAVTAAIGAASYLGLLECDRRLGLVVNGKLQPLLRRFLLTMAGK